MSNLNRAFIRVYREQDAPPADHSPQDERPVDPSVLTVRQAQGTCIVGVWTGNDRAGSTAKTDESATGAEADARSPRTEPLRLGSHLPAALAAAAAADRSDPVELSRRAAGVEYLRPFAPLPPAQNQTVSDQSAATREGGGGSAAPRARVIYVKDAAHNVPAPHFDAATAAQSSQPAPAPPAEPAAQPAREDSTAPTQPAPAPQAADPAPAPQVADPAPASQAADPVPDAGPFRPAWEVDNVEWPAAIGQLFAEQPERFDELADTIVQLADGGAKRIAVIGSCPGAGATMLALCLARRLAEVVRDVALVDGNLSNPNLATDLDVNLEAGWEDALTGRQAAEEVAVHAVENGITLLPLLEPATLSPEAEIGQRAAEITQRLAASHDIVLLDAGSAWDQGVDLLTADEAAPAVDAAILVRDVRQTGDRQLKVAVAALGNRGIPVAAIAENFQAPAATRGIRKAA